MMMLLFITYTVLGFFSLKNFRNFFTKKIRNEKNWRILIFLFYFIFPQKNSELQNLQFPIIYLFIYLFIKSELKENLHFWFQRNDGYHEKNWKEPAV
jgi:hypothetical protein